MNASKLYISAIRYASILITLLCITSLPLLAQEITEDDVNDVASKMYCPTCENVPLDACGTVTCIDWKAEIQDRLIAGESEQEIINSFVARFGEHVVGVPQDPILRMLSLVTPLFIILVVIGFGAYIFSIWRKQNQHLRPVIGTSNEVTKTEDEYRQQLERDLQERR